MVIAGLLAVGVTAVAQGGDAVKPSVAAKVGPVSVSPDGTRCVTVPVGPISPTFCENKKTGETSFGVSTPAGSLQVGGRGSSGSNNFIKVGAPSVPGVVGVQGSVKVKTPSLTRSGITSATTLE
jgi:hypothetical protein